MSICKFVENGIHDNYVRQYISMNVPNLYSANLDFMQTAVMNDSAMRNKKINFKDILVYLST